MTEWKELQIPNQEQLRAFSLDDLKQKEKDFKDAISCLEEWSPEREKLEIALKLIKQLIQTKEKRINELKEEQKVNKKWSELLESKVKINDISPEDAKLILKYLNNNYENWQFEEWGGWVEKLASLKGVVTLEDIKTNKDVNNVQGVLINKIYWEWSFKRWYSQDWNFILGFNNEKGNFVHSMEEFENKLQTTVSINDINSKMLANYFIVLNNKWELEKELDAFNVKTLRWLEQVWKDKSSIAYKMIADKWETFIQGIQNRIKEKLIKSFDLTQWIQFIKETLELFKNDTEKVEFIDKYKESFSIIESSNDLKPILDLYENTWKHLEFQYLPKVLQNEWENVKNIIFSDTIKFTDENFKNPSKTIEFMNDNFFNNNMEKIIEKIAKEWAKRNDYERMLTMWDWEYLFLCKAISSQVSNSRINKLLKNYKIDIKHLHLFNLINPNEVKISKSIKEKVDSPDYLTELEKRDPTKEEVDYVLQNIKSIEKGEKYIDILIKMIDKQIANPNLWFHELLNLPIKNKRYIWHILENRPEVYISLWWKLDDESKIDAFLKSDLWRNAPEFAVKNGNVTDSSWVFKILDFMMSNCNSEKDFEKKINEEFIKDFKYVLLLNKVVEEGSINNKYVEVFLQLKKILYEHKDFFISKFVTEAKIVKNANNALLKVEELKKRNWNLNKEKAQEKRDKFSKELTSIIWEEVINDILKDNKDILSLDALRTPDWLKPIIKKLAEIGKTPKEIEDILEKVSKLVEKTLEHLIKILAKEIPPNGVDKRLRKIVPGKDGKEVEEVDDEKVKVEFKKYIAEYLQKTWKKIPTQEDIEILKEEFTSKYAWDLKWEQREKFKKLLEYSFDITQHEIFQNNADKYVAGFLNWQSFYETQEELVQQWIDVYWQVLNKKEALSIPWYNPETWKVTINRSDWTEVNLQLSEQEKKLVEDIWEVAVEKIQSFYKTLDKVWLTQLWSYREQIFTWIQNTKPNFRADNFDYLNDYEIKVFLNAILKSTWRQEVLMTTSTLDEFLEKVRNQNGENLFWLWEQVEQVTTMYWWRSTIEQEFLNKFAPEFVFRPGEFENSIKKEENSIN